MAGFGRRLLEVSRSEAIDAGDLDAALQTIVHAACEGLPVRRASVWQFDADHAGMRCTALHDTASGPGTAPLTLTAARYPRYFEALASERAIVADDACTHPATAEFAGHYLVPQGISAMLDAPVRLRGKMVGILCCEHLGPARVWSLPEQAFAASLADLVGRALTARARRQAEDALRELNAALEERVAQRTEALAAALTTQQQLQAQLIESEKFASLAGLVAGVAHEVNTPLGSALTANSLVDSELAELRLRFAGGQLGRVAMTRALDTLQDGCRIVDANLQRAAELVRGFKQVAVNQSNEVRQSFAVCDEIATLLLALRPEYKRRPVEVHLDCPTPCHIDSYPGALGQVVTNLVMNALRHAFPADGAGRIDIRVRREGAGVRIEVADNGVGMTPALQRKVFEPFFTTRRHDGGTGLGLFIVHNLVTQALQGRITLESQPGAGTRFIVDLPATLGAVHDS